MLFASGCAGPRAAVREAVMLRRVDLALRAYDRFYDSDGSDPELLADIAAWFWRRKHRAPDRVRSDAALSQLRMAGSAGVSSLEHLAQQGSANAFALARSLR